MTSFGLCTILPPACHPGRSGGAKRCRGEPGPRTYFCCGSWVPGLARGLARDDNFRRAIFQRRIPIGKIDVCLTRFNAMLDCVAHDLGRSIKPHRLGIQQRTRERRRIMTLQPRRDVDEMRKTRSVTLGKAIFAEALDLRKAALREFRLITACHHLRDHLFFEKADRAAPPEGRHRLAQLVHFGVGELRRVHGDAHRLLLK